MRFRVLFARLTAAIAIGSVVLLAVRSTQAQQPSPADVVKGQLLAPKAFRAAAAKVLPSIVRIESFGGIPGGSGRVAGEGPTTGVILSDDGYIVTSTFNFIKNPPIITVVTRDGARHVAKLVGRDDSRKICLLKIEVEETLPVPENAPLDKLRVGQWAISVGVGFGEAEPAFSAGIVSALNRMGGRAIQTDANTSPANYGGPLIDIDGRVIGICVPLAPGGQQEAGSGVEWYDSGIGFAIPLDGADRVITAMKSGKTLAPAFLGVALKAIEGEEGGVLVSQLQPGGAAEKAGVKVNDRVLKIDGEEIRDGTQLRAIVGRHLAGDEITFTVGRDEQTLELKITLDQRPQG